MQRCRARHGRDLDGIGASPLRAGRHVVMLTAPRNTDVNHPDFVSEGALRGFGRIAFHRGYTIEGAYTHATATIGRTLDEAELGAVADGWNAAAGAAS